MNSTSQRNAPSGAPALGPESLTAWSAHAAEPLCEVDLDAIGHNLRAVRSMVRPATRLMAVVKADAYGHGAVAVATHLERCGVELFAVATVSEGIELRQHGIAGRILVLIPTLPLLMEKAISHDLTLSLASLTDATLASRIAAHVGTRARAHLMVDTGLSRGGFHPTELREALPELCRLRGLDITGIWGHFAAIEPLEEARNTVRGFQELVAHAQHFCSLRFVHMASSGAIASLPESHFTVVRPGLALYGYLPCRRNGTALVPAMRPARPPP